jgi:hypothetical protein
MQHVKLLISPVLALLGLAATGWAQCEQAMLVASSTTSGMEFGGAVSLSGDTLAVGACFKSDVAPLGGSVYVLDRVGGLWVESAELRPSDTAVFDYFGCSISLSGDRLLVGSTGRDDATTNAGAAYMYERQSGVWVETAKLTASDAALQGAFGSSVALDGDRAVIGARNNSLAFVPGAAYVFELQGGAWVETAKLTSGITSEDWFGYAVALSGDRALIGAPLEDAPPLDRSGAAYVYDLQGAAWVQTARLVASDPGDLDRLGLSVALDGGVAVAGAYWDAVPTLDAGSVYVFELAGSSWSETAKLISADPGTPDWFGYSLSLVGDVLVVGVPNDQNYTGSVEVFQQTGGTWQAGPILYASDAAMSQFGFAVDYDGTTAVIGAPTHSGAASNGGATYVFGLTPSSPAEVVRLGTPANPDALRPGVTSGPAIGSIWDPFIDHAVFQPAAIADFVGVTATGANVSLPPFGTLLCDLATLIMLPTSAPGVPFAISIPNDCSLIGATLCAQGASVDALVSISLANALDITIGSF